MSDKAAQTVVSASTAFAARFGAGVDNAVTDYTQIATIIPSTSNTTGYGFLDRFPRVREWIGERHLNKLKSYNYSVTNKKFESTISVPREDFEDNDYGKYAPVFEDMGREANEFPNEYIFGLLKQGFEELCFDGKPFFSKEHPINEKGEVQSNLFISDAGNASKPWFLLDTSRALKPLIWQERIKPEMQTLTNMNNNSHTFLHDEYLYGIRARGNAGFSFWQLAAATKADLNSDNFNAVYSMMTARKDPQERPMHIRPTVLVVPPSLRQQAHDVVLKERIDGGDSNINYKIVDVFVCPWLE
ncbi:MAG: Mu-like prophage major head subunit gpT family protein [Vibrio sp.]|uniref:Mu-like prophage major head subunit gpT family protein n=1 Tax=Vibrio sp. TaxID=678 RepID=UPI003A835A88